MSAAADDMTLTNAERDKLRTELDALIEWIAYALDDTVTRQTVHPTGPKTRRAKRGSTEEDTPLPFHPPAAEIAWELANTLNAWITHITTARTLTHPGRLGIIPAAKYLRTNRYLNGLALTPEGPQGFDEICHAIHRAARAVDRPPMPSYAGPCPICKADLWARPDETKLVCRACDDVVTTRTDNDERIASELADRLFTATELVRIVEARLGQRITSKTIHNLARHRITDRGRSREGDKLYRCGDVLDALIAQQDHPKPRRAQHA
ncbi:hypothetical protein [Tsukamurella sp. 1534]|uniref:hypothetical protein n=1 Tax=Tsukamurella sp. 1534 TaxID=1151061 RepID=UPI000303A82F|nr:hypothetical protein [Tsukamurella sp. 1534]